MNIAVTTVTTNPLRVGLKPPYTGRNVTAFSL